MSAQFLSVKHDSVILSIYFIVDAFCYAMQTFDGNGQNINLVFTICILINIFLEQKCDSRRLAGAWRLIGGHSVLVELQIFSLGRWLGKQYKF